MSDNGAARSGTECDVREYVQEYAYDPIGGSDLCNCFLGKRRERVVRCRDCEYLDTMSCPIKRALVCDGASATDVVAPGGFCAWGQVRAGSSEVRAGEGE